MELRTDLAADTVRRRRLVVRFLVVAGRFFPTVVCRRRLLFTVLFVRLTFRGLVLVFKLRRRRPPVWLLDGRPPSFSLIFRLAVLTASLAKSLAADLRCGLAIRNALRPIGMRLRIKDRSRPPSP